MSDAPFAGLLIPPQEGSSLLEQPARVPYPAGAGLLAVQDVAAWQWRPSSGRLGTGYDLHTPRGAIILGRVAAPAENRIELVRVLNLATALRALVRHVRCADCRDLLGAPRIRPEARCASCDEVRLACVLQGLEDEEIEEVLS